MTRKDIITIAMTAAVSAGSFALFAAASKKARDVKKNLAEKKLQSETIETPENTVY